MNINIINRNNKNIALIIHQDKVITNTQTTLDLMATVRYHYDCDCIILHKSAICDDFFDLKTKIAGEILQKFSNYNFKMAIIGDFACCESKSLRDFIYESNKGRSIFFLPTETEALEKLSR